MNGKSHRVVTERAFDILHSITPLDSKFPLYDSKSVVAEGSVHTDHLNDMEFVNVQGGWVSSGRDDPHESSRWDIDDKPHTSGFGRNFTAFNHFIDIKRGPGVFDDFDGYSYKKGSASRNEYQVLRDATDNQWVGYFNELLKLPSVITAVLGHAVDSVKVDEGINFWFNDEYVHAPGHKWYRNCSPAVARYSFFGDKGIYANIEEEAKKRFPLAASPGALFGQGIPHSVFMPVDNLARFWYGAYQGRLSHPVYLGLVMHAIQDATVPHHAAGYLGNWHGTYEARLDQGINRWFGRQRFVDDIIALYKKWLPQTQKPPTSLAVNDWSLVPASNWRIDFLVTWLALNAYRAYAQTYNHFKNGFAFNRDNAKELTKKATAICMLLLPTKSSLPAIDEGTGTVVGGGVGGTGGTGGAGGAGGAGGVIG